ncbi:MAG: DUF2185 domain-containing protein [Prevotellaceae bacterium]|jgi:hypothetical protein|nr:DUF2185 domain-containing protein [Prevotellaceae bacterium]
MKKIFKLKAENIKRLVSPMGGCIATDTITVDGLQVGYMDRYTSDNENNSGWCFMTGTESHEYIDDPANMGVYDINTIANYDPAIIPYLSKPHGTSRGCV